MNSRGFLHKLKLLPAYLVPLLLLFPILAWMALDQFPFGGDQSHYGTEAIHLFSVLTHSPSEWGSQMLDAVRYKPPGIVWFGQFFIPFRKVLGSIDFSLLFCILFIQLLALILLYQSFLKLSQGRFSIAILGCLITGSAPLFVGLSHEFMMEPLQLLAVAYFIFIMTFAPGWSRGFTLSHLLLATALAILAKTTSPLYCLGPGLLALIHVFRPNASRYWEWLRTGTLITLIAGIVLSIAATMWYLQNFAAVRRFVSLATTEPIAQYWGKEDTFLNSLIYWLGAVQRSFFLPPVLLLSGIIVATGVACWLLRSDRSFNYFTLCSGVAILQLVCILVVFSTQTNRSSRFLLASLPYIALVISWCVIQIPHKVAAYLALIIFTSQLAFIHLYAWGFIGYQDNSDYLRPFHRSEKERRILEEIVFRTCTTREAKPYVNIIGIDPLLKGDWLAPQPANYVKAKSQILNGESNSPCHYDYLGTRFIGAAAKEVWEQMLVRRVRYLITVNPDIYPPDLQVYNQALDRDNFPVIMRKVRASGIFSLELPLAEDSGIIIFHRVNQILFGRALSDLGHHRIAFEELNQSTILEPDNLDAWFNLALACERHGKLKRARTAANRALSLIPDNDERLQERVELLSMMARINLRERKTSQACRLLRQVFQLKPDAHILNEMQSHGCSKLQP